MNTLVRDRDLVLGTYRVPVAVGEGWRCASARPASSRSEDDQTPSRVPRGKTRR